MGAPVEPAGDEPEFPRDHNARSFRVEAVGAVRLELALFTERRDDIVEKAAKFVQVRDRFDAQKATDIIGIAKAVGEMVEAERKKISGPHYEAARAVNDYVTAFWQPVGDAIAGLTAKLDTFANEEEARIRAQQEEQAAHEARLRAATAADPRPAPPPPAAAPQPAKRRPIRGDYGFSAHARDADVIEIEDVHALPGWVFQSQPVIDAIIATVKPLVSKKIPIPGLRVTQVKKTSVRR